MFERGAHFLQLVSRARQLAILLGKRLCQLGLLLGKLRISCSVDRRRRGAERSLQFVQLGVGRLANALEFSVAFSERLLSVGERGAKCRELAGAALLQRLDVGAQRGRLSSLIDETRLKLGSRQIGSGNFSSDSRFLYAMRTDADTAVGRRRQYSVQLRLPLSDAPQVDVTPQYLNFPNGEPLINTLGFRHLNNIILQLISSPNGMGAVNLTQSPVALASISPEGGKTPRLSWGTAIPELKSASSFNFYSCVLSFRTIFFCNNDTAQNGAPQFGDAYISRSGAATSVPAVMLLLATLLLSALQL